MLICKSQRDPRTNVKLLRVHLDLLDVHELILGQEVGITLGKQPNHVISLKIGDLLVH